MRTRLAAVLGTLAAGLALAAAMPPLDPAGAGEEVAKKLEEFKEYLKTNPDSQGIRNQIADLSLLKAPEVAEALMPLLRNPKYDDDVKIAVCQAVGKQGKKEIGAVLLNMADGKPWEEKPKLRAAAIEGAGDADAKANYKELMKIAKKYLPTNGDIAIAALRGCSQYVTRDTVEDMLAELTVVSSGLKASEAAKRPHYDAERPVIMELLKKMTGLDYGEPAAWKRWWDENKKTWEPPVPGKETKKDINASDTYSDSALGLYEIRKPNKRWTFKQTGTGPAVTLEALEEGQRAAWCDVFIQGAKNMKSQSAEALAKEVRDLIEPKFRDIKPGSTWEKPCSYGGVKGIEHVVTGQHKDFDAIHMHNVFLFENGFAYRIETYYKSGKAASLSEDIEAFLKSIRLKK
jgi:hypothetical protein